MWSQYPGQGHPPSSSAPPSDYGFPSPSVPGYNPGYNPGYISPPPDGGSQYPYGTYAPPPGPPPTGYHAHQLHGGYAPPPGPPSIPPRPTGSHYGSPMGPPPSEYRGLPANPQLPPSGHQDFGNHMYYEYSQCNGKKKGLCIGINYFGQNGELKGCINDANNVSRFLQGLWGYRADDIVMLTDDSPNPRAQPTKDNIIRAMQWLVNGAQPNDSLFFHYSGHGGQTKDLDGDEADGYDEVIYPVDFQQAGHIIDDDMHRIMVQPLPPGCRLTAIFDSCHSGSVLDLPYIYSTEGKIKEPNLAAEAGQGLLSAATSYARGDMGGVFTSVSGLLKTATGGGQRAEKQARQTKTSPADAISWSGCKDSQTSADTFEAGQSTGAMSYAFTTCLSQKPRQTYQELLVNVRNILRAKYSQKPQLSSSHPIDVNLLFIC